MSASRLTFRVHAVQRMAQRGISEEDVRSALEHNEVIEEYPDDTPYPSRLMLGFHDGRPIHIVVADNSEGQEIIVITVYQPGPDRWDETFRRRKKR